MTVVDFEVIKHLSKKNNEKQLLVAIEKIESRAKVLLDSSSPLIKRLGENILEILEVITNPVDTLLHVHRLISSKNGSYGFNEICKSFENIIEATGICYCGFCFNLIARDDNDITVITGIRYHNECLKINELEHQDFLFVKNKKTEGIKE